MYVESLKLKAIEMESFGERTAKDKRRRVNSIVASYTDRDGNEYRKRFNSYDKPIVPEFGTHEYLNSMREQFFGIY